ncbi:hypothetical protein SBDP1_570006 [Syntrophobacter sp. SbD1]|nr:hypothetical protein SBDP1_570006 [Syntrophobacter sp. SbD1]
MVWKVSEEVRFIVKPAAFIQIVTG